MIKNVKIRRIFLSLLYPLIAFWQYWYALDGNYARDDMLWGAVVTIAFALALYLYFPVAKKIENGSGIWILGLFALILLLSLGLDWMGIGLSDTVLNVMQVPVAREAWGQYIVYSVIFTATFHWLAKQQDKSRAISWFTGPARWNKTQG